MNGPQDYREAERRLAEIGAFNAEETSLEQAQLISAGLDRAVAIAQVHATLALAAATAYPAVKDYCGDESNDSREWAGATS